MHAGIWGMALVVALRIFSVARVIVIARLLSPSAFGIFGVATIITSFQETILQRLMFSALIQRKGDIESYLDTVWTVRLIANAILVAVFFAVSGLIADLLNAPGAVMIIRVMLLVVLVRSLSNIGVVYFEKKLEFQKRFAYELSLFAVEAVVGVALVLATRDVWALVYGALAGSIFQVAFSYVLHRRRPRLSLDWQLVLELMRYDRWVLGSLTLIYAVNHIDQAVVSRVGGVAQLGLFRMGAQLSRSATTEVGGVISRVTFPAFSQLQGQQEKLRRGFLHAHQWTATFMLPIVVGAITLADELTQVVFGEQWVPMVPAFRLMLAAGFVASLMLINNSLYLGIGRPRIGFGILTARLILLGVMIVPLTMQWGAAGAAFGVLVSQVVVYPYALWQSARVTGAGSAEFVKTLIVPFVATAGMFGFLLTVREGIGEIQTISALVATVLGGAMVYITGLLIVDYLYGGEMYRFLRQKMSSQFSGSAG